jgi:hypothetical protein
VTVTLGDLKRREAGGLGVYFDTSGVASRGVV